VLDCNGILPEGSESEERLLLPNSKRCLGAASRGASYRWSAINFRVRPCGLFRWGCFPDAPLGT